MRITPAFLFFMISIAGVAGAETVETSSPLNKDSSVFFSATHRARATENIARHKWASDIQKKIVAEAEPFLAMSDDELWSLVFGNTIKRSWMVWSDGHCAACKKSVPMYTWKIDAMNRRWKVQCPHCSEIFPKNDFHAFYKSGLDEHGVFQPAKADRRLLVNQEHATEGDPLRTFGVDDGEGYVDGEKRWRFIGAYLIYGQWKQLIVGGAKKLSAAYAVTGDAQYAHKAGVLLDRIADLYPTFSYLHQGIMYDDPSTADGYVSVWHDACVETRDLTFAYDTIYDAIAKDKELAAFSSRQAQAFKPAHEKNGFADIQRNIEERILRDALKNRVKIESNFPQTDYTNAVIMTVLGGPGSKDAVYGLLKQKITVATHVDGVTGEKGLQGYASYTIKGLGELLGYFDRIDPEFLPWALKEVPNLSKAYRFHIDTWCMGKYYPSSGDGGNFGAMYKDYNGLTMSKDPGIVPSSFNLLWKLYEHTGDAGYAQVLYGANDGKVDNLPYDLCAENVEQFQKNISAKIQEVGATPTIRSVNFKDWHIALLRSGQDAAERILWLDYDSGGKHSHCDGLNLGLYGYGIDLMPDFGYPPVQYGGWEAPRSRWYMSSAAHNTVVVDGKNHVPGGGKTTLFADGKLLKAITAASPVSGADGLFERTAAIINISPTQFYVVDFFRVSGGSVHQKFMHSHFGEVTTAGRELKAVGDYLQNPHMRNWLQDASKKDSWDVDWRIDDRMGARKTSEPLHLRYTDLTHDAERFVCEGWISYAGFNTNREAWIPRVMTERRAPGPGLHSTFVSVIEPFERESAISSIKRTNTRSEGTTETAAPVRLEVALANGKHDTVIFNPAGETSLGDVSTDAKLLLIRRQESGKGETAVLCGGKLLKAEGININLTKADNINELDLNSGL